MSAAAATMTTEQRLTALSREVNAAFQMVKAAAGTRTSPFDVFMARFSEMVEQVRSMNDNRNISLPPESMDSLLCSLDAAQASLDCSMENVLRVNFAKLADFTLNELRVRYMEQRRSDLLYSSESRADRSDQTIMDSISGGTLPDNVTSPNIQSGNRPTSQQATRVVGERPSSSSAMTGGVLRNNSLPTTTTTGTMVRKTPGRPRKIVAKDTKSQVTCDICHQSFSNWSVMQLHRMRQHGQRRYERRWRCDECKKCFGTQAKLEEHKNERCGVHVKRHSRKVPPTPDSIAPAQKMVPPTSPAVPSSSGTKAFDRSAKSPIIIVPLYRLEQNSPVPSPSNNNGLDQSPPSSCSGISNNGLSAPDLSSTLPGPATSIKLENGLFCLPAEETNSPSIQ